VKPKPKPKPKSEADAGSVLDRILKRLARDPDPKVRAWARKLAAGDTPGRGKT
jgi:hypothetical protein